MKPLPPARLKGLRLLCDRARWCGSWFLPRRVGDLAMTCLVLLSGILVFSAKAAKLAEVRTVDDEIVMVRWLDSEVEWKDTGTGPGAFRGLEESAGEVRVILRWRYRSVSHFLMDRRRMARKLWPSRSQN